MLCLPTSKEHTTGRSPGWDTCGAQLIRPLCSTWYGWKSLHTPTSAGFTTKACGYEDATVFIAIHPSLTTEAPDVVEFLRNWSFNITLYTDVARYMADNPGSEAQDGAIWFLKNKEATWSSWVPADVAQKVKDALASD